MPAVELAAGPGWWWAVLGLGWGAAMGSFACVLAERGRMALHGRSHCACGRQLTWLENVPLVAWPVLRGRARCCRVPIPAWYWVAEAGGAVSCAMAGWLLGPAGMAAALCTVGGMGVVARRVRAKGPSGSGPSTST